MSTKPEKIDHATFREQIAVALAGGLSSTEQSAFDAHVKACEACAAELSAAQAVEERMTALFASVSPIPGFEDRIVQRLRLRREPRLWRPNWRLHPALGKAAAGVAAAIVLAGFGYVATEVLEREETSRVMSASNLRKVGQSQILPANDNRGTYPRSETDVSDYDRSSGYSVRFDGKGVNVGSGGKPNNQWGDQWGITTSDDLGIKNGAAAGVQLGTNINAGTLVLGGKVVDAHNSTTTEDFTYTQASGPANAPASGEKKPSSSSTDFFFANPTAANNFSGKPDNVRYGWFKPTDLGLQVDASGKVVNNESLVRLQVQDAKRTPQIVALADGAENAQKVPARELMRQSSTPATPSVAFGAEAPADTAVPAPAPVAQAVAPAPVEAPPAPQTPPVEAPQATTRKVIRNGQLEFEVDRYDAAFAQVSKLTTEAGGYVGTTDSEKLPNGKVKGTVTVRVPPDRLDTLVLQLRGIGDLKSQKMEAQDVSKRYSDMDSELRAARAMEERLLAIIKEGKGQIKDLLAAEKELGNWRTKIEKLVGEMKYYDNQVALSTLNITLYERDIKTPATARETETIDTGVETDDVEKARTAALKAIEDSKGRVIQSDLKRYDAGQFAATIIADVPADNAGAMLDRLKQLGKMARLDIQRKQTNADNAPPNVPLGTNAAPVRVEKQDTRLNLSLYNLAQVEPRQATTLNIAADDVESAYRAIIARVAKAGGRVVKSNLARNKPEETTGKITFEVPSAEADAVKADVQASGETMKLAVDENPDVQNSTTAKRGFAIDLASTASKSPREIATLKVAATDVIAARDRILQAAGSVPGAARVLSSQLNANDQQNVSATIELDVRRGETLAKVEKAIADAGQTINRVVARLTDTENTLDSKVRLKLTLGPADTLPPRETTTMSVELSDVEAAMGDLSATAQQLGGRTVESNLSKTREGQNSAHVIVDVPLDKAGEIIKRAKDVGAVRSIESGKNLQVPAGALAKARLNVTFNNREAIVTPDNGFWASIRQGLSTSVAGLMLSLRFIVVGLCFVLPWVAVLYAGWRFIKRRRQTDVTAPAAS